MVMEGTTPTTAPVTSPEVDRAVVLDPVGSGDALVPADAGRAPEAKFVSIYRSDYEQLVRVAYLIVGSQEQAEEIVQEAFVRLHGRWSRVISPRSYLRTSVVNGCRDAIRRRARWRRREAALVTPSTSTDEPDELFDALARLNPRQRAVVVLRFYEGLQEAEIAEAVGMKVGTVKSTIHRSIELLRKEIER
jgi:RNA polymerase sigma-70 factor (sigma-E family)